MFCEVCLGDLFEGRECQRRHCERGSIKWSNYQSRNVVENLAAYAAMGGDCRMITLTAPGADVIPWDPRACRGSEDHRHSGRLGCKVSRVHASAWDVALPDRMSRLIKIVRQRVCDRTGVTTCSFDVVVWVVEEQRRGILHVHLALGWRSARGRAELDIAIKGFTDRKLLRRLGFGPQVKVGAPGRESAASIAGYLGRYIRPNNRKAPLVPALLRIREACPRQYDRERQTWRRRRSVRVVHVARFLSRESGVTMSTLRHRSYCFIKWGPGVPAADVELAWRLRQAFPGTELLAPGPIPPRAPPSRSSWTPIEVHDQAGEQVGLW